MRKKIRLISITLLSWFIIHSIVIVLDGLSDDEKSAEIAVIFGTTVNEDGTLSARLKARLDRGLELYQEKLVSTIVVSGGLGKEGHLEGDKMRNYLIKNNVKADNIWVDNEGNNSQLTINNTLRKYPKVKSIIVVSQYFHVSRCKLAFRKAGVENVYAVSPSYFEWRDFYSIFREFFGYYKYLVL
jgi:vancomycin permeability regulator SanA